MVAKPLYQYKIITLNPTKLLSRGSRPPTLQVDRAVSKWTMDKGWAGWAPPTLHDLQMDKGWGPPNPNGQGLGAPNPSRLGAAGPPTLQDLSSTLYALGWGATNTSPKIGKPVTGPLGPELSPNAKPKFSSWCDVWVRLGRIWFGWLDGLPRCE